MSHAVVEINNHDYTKYIKAKTGFGWARENTNDEDAGRDRGEKMHTNVTSHQRKLTFKMGPMSFAIAQQLEADLSGSGNDEGVVIKFPDLDNGLNTKMLFYNTSIEAAQEAFLPDGDIVVDNVSFTVESVEEATVT